MQKIALYLFIIATILNICVTAQKSDSNINRLLTLKKPQVLNQNQEYQLKKQINHSNHINQFKQDDIQYEEGDPQPAPEPQPEPQPDPQPKPEGKPDEGSPDNPNPPTSIWDRLWWSSQQNLMYKYTGLIIILLCII
ncbi:transmembrane protein, putative (macronuclear) [Tetrahymena thermophila SB210]|uniref:Transmembrane protein, putative n=1 Tax=Tetrahymena thermophila (strain SB210) TaxID=312017 RepID=Q233Y9_TETTS|nr:transmembrane protein, putative [Tetrahymena thermophila SB210]EAR92113.2 transmembrane protein, putative [Tetrahymena thermophila SB210]|eukprot:XP_001012359.2 transmembrane protein, putative [Tetrahymena thermophila SB210]